MLPNACHHKWAGYPGLCKIQLNTKLDKNFRPHDPAHLREWRVIRLLYF